MYTLVFKYTGELKSLMRLSHHGSCWCYRYHWPTVMCYDSRDSKSFLPRLKARKKGSFWRGKNSFKLYVFLFFWDIFVNILLPVTWSRGMWWRGCIHAELSRWTSWPPTRTMQSIWRRGVRRRKTIHVETLHRRSVVDTVKVSYSRITNLAADSQLFHTSSSSCFGRLWFSENSRKYGLLLAVSFFDVVILYICQTCRF